MDKVSMSHVRKVYDNGFVAVDDFSLDIKENEFIVLVGPSGCGKSTLLRMIAGLEEISHGEIRINNQVVNHMAPKDRDIAMVFQNYALYPHMTVYENMAFGLRQRKEKREVIDAKVREAAETLGLTALLERKPKALSGGQRQRVAIGRAIVRKPQVFLMDEPLSNLDAKLRNQMRSELIKLRQRVNTTFIYVTHDQTEAMTLGDRIVIMRDGFIQQIGTPMDLYDYPRNLFVAGFVGMPQMNFLSGQLKYSDNQAWITLKNEVEIPITASRFDLTQEEPNLRNIVVGIRPEHLTIVTDDIPGSIKGKLIVHELMGNEVHLHVDYLGDELVLRIPTSTWKEEIEPTLHDNQSIYFVIDPDTIHIFDSVTEESLIRPAGEVNV